MIGVDTNIIIQHLVKSHPGHERALEWVNGVKESLATTGTNLAEVLRLLTHPRVFESPLELDTALRTTKTWLADFNVSILEESESWWEELDDLLRIVPGLRGDEVFDARIALCLRYHGIRGFCTSDSDFSKYPFLKLIRI